jgi:ABC-type branched-subunit amino acid transport system ATPase component
MSTGIDTKTNQVDEAVNANVVARNINTGYGNHQVLHDVSAQTRDGVTCVFGPNGSGKSTLMKAIAGIIPVWSGSVHNKGKEITGTSPANIVRDGIIALPQDGGLFHSMSIHDNLLLGGYTVGDRATINERVERAYELFPALADKKNLNAVNLSGGQQMMLSFARAMISGADTYLLDEPSAGLSPALVDDLLEIIETLVEEGNQILLVEQNVNAALQIADYVYILVQGEVRFDGTPAELAEEEEIMDLYLGID